MFQVERSKYLDQTGVRMVQRTEPSFEPISSALEPQNYVKLDFLDFFFSYLYDRPILYNRQIEEKLSIVK